jgi:hypothetical protein
LNSLDLLLWGHPAGQSRLGLAGGVGTFAKEKEVEPEPVEHDGDSPHNQLQRQPVHRVGDAQRGRDAERRRDDPGGDPDAPHLGLRGGRVTPQLLELGEAAREHDDEEVGDDREHEVALVVVVARAVDGEREADGHAEEEEQPGDHGARDAPAPTTLALHLPRPMLRHRRRYRCLVTMCDGEHGLHARRRGDLQRGRSSCLLQLRVTWIDDRVRIAFAGVSLLHALHCELYRTPTLSFIGSTAAASRPPESLNRPEKLWKVQSSVASRRCGHASACFPACISSFLRQILLSSDQFIEQLKALEFQ